ncbi:hypothetical protein AB0F42_24300 [Streptomyces buecherae]|uniref:hypothetical protein n=1 Tax=Streptomyces buecherae TaxID=2763006 RepID=UPI003411A721
MSYQDAPLPPRPPAADTRADILAGLHAAEATTIGDETPEHLVDRHDAAVRAEVLAEAAAEIESIDAHPNATGHHQVIYRALGQRLRRMSAEAVRDA